MSSRRGSQLLQLAAALFLAPPAAAEVTIDWVTVGDPGNAADTEVMTCCGVYVGTSGYGAVPDQYRIGKFEVTNAQYVEFLNAVAASDTHDVHNFIMGITKSGSPGSFTYSVLIAGQENYPVDGATFWDAVRFANWLHNGQPTTGAEDDTTTEDGAYTLTADGIANNTITRNAGARVFVPNADEWYKAAYYDPGSATYFDYPTGTDTRTACVPPPGGTNTANCQSPLVSAGPLSDVGSHASAVSPNGTFDQGGNLWEWLEDIAGANRAVRGGAYTSACWTDLTFPCPLASMEQTLGNPVGFFSFQGFRVASLPVPVPSLDPLRIALLCALLTIAGSWALRRQPETRR